MNPDTCTCGHPNCIRNQCDHCYCQQSPKFDGTQTVGYVGPIYMTCCKCRHRYQSNEVRSWGSVLPYQVRR